VPESAIDGASGLQVLDQVLHLQHFAAATTLCCCGSYTRLLPLPLLLLLLLLLLQVPESGKDGASGLQVLDEVLGMAGQPSS
jgi:hypothetical protein